MASVANVSIGACQVIFGGQDLGHTIGGVLVTYTPTYKDIAVDKYGNTVVEKYLMGEKLEAKVKLAEFTIANLSQAIPNAVPAGATTGHLNIGRVAGRQITPETELLVLHPLRFGSGNRSQDIVFLKAAIVSAVPIPNDNSNEKTLEVTFEALLLESQADGSYLGLIGDSTT